MNNKNDLCEKHMWRTTWKIFDISINRRIAVDLTVGPYAPWNRSDGEEVSTEAAALLSWATLYEVKLSIIQDILTWHFIALRHSLSYFCWHFLTSLFVYKQNKAKCKTSKLLPETKYDAASLFAPLQSTTKIIICQSKLNTIIFVSSAAQQNKCFESSTMFF